MLLQKILNPFKKVLIRYRYRGKKNPLEEFNKLKENDKLPPITKGPILVIPIRMSATAHLFEGYISYAYRLKGYKVYALMCGQKLSVCENKGLGLFSNLKCSICYAEQIEFCKTFDIEPLWVGDYLNKIDQKDIDKNLVSLDLDLMLYNDVDLKLHIKSGLMRILKTSIVKLDQLPLLKKYGKTAMQMYVSTKKILKEISPSHVLLSHGIYSTWGGAIEACKESGINTVVWGRGYVGKGNILATRNNSYLFENIFEPTSNYINKELTEEKLNKVKKYFLDKRTPSLKVDSVNYYKNKEDINEHINLYEYFKLDHSKKIFGMFPNIPWDGQTFNVRKNFNSIRQFVRSTISWIVENDCYLIIRAHPAESHERSKGQFETFHDVLKELYSELPDSVIFLPSDSKISSYQVEKNIVAALLYAGTIGLEFAINKTPVIQVGQHFNSYKGFIFEPVDEIEYFNLLSLAKAGKLKMNKTMLSNAMKYGYHWIFNRHIPEDVIEFGAELKFMKYVIKESNDLKNNKIVNWFIDRIEDKQPFVYEAND